MFPNVSHAFEMLLEEMYAFTPDFWYGQKYCIFLPNQKSSTSIVRKRTLHIKNLTNIWKHIVGFNGIKICSFSKHAYIVKFPKSNDVGVTLLFVIACHVQEMCGASTARKKVTKKVYYY